jgi:molybdenum transport protein
MKVPPKAFVEHDMKWVEAGAELEALLADDVPYGDLTTQALGIGDAPGALTLAARDAMVIAEVEPACGRA